MHLLQSLLPLGKPWPSPIPRFILDTNHPWLATNKAWLSRYPNVAKSLCSRDSPLWTSPVAPDHALPEDLFTHLLIDNNRFQYHSCQERLGWSNARDRLREMAACEAALADVQHLHVDVYIHDSEYSTYVEPTSPPPALPELFADVLARMSNLERLDWGISSEATRAFEPAFVVKDLTLPSVKYLQPGAGSDYLVSRCPNLEVLEAGDYSHHWSWRTGSGHRLDLVKASTGLKNLKEWRLAAGWDGWTLHLLEDILDATPNITSLRMDGNLYDLENLQLPPSSDLDLGFDGGHWCGNAYDGPEGRVYGRAVTQQDAETTELAANITLSALPHLKSLRIGSACANLTLNGRGQPDMTWPWTGRMEQYTYEIWEE
ncbi:hypothetical protein J7T55_005261 [Diaporthe amygdali]|uniref:uncharacterized protein n=1 Tax=Phomopsis amygdali TaxID=1214568 RepID=UPI0022FE95E7|nr:uncharacterized protein J7T55_005261 [Diaporthe amygdali]KAJ0108284.1 hypothetical protein J7T55_005261 [Diaporthe amygdali]